MIPQTQDQRGKNLQLAHSFITCGCSSRRRQSACEVEVDMSSQISTRAGICNNLCHSLRPIFVWLQVIGIDLITCQSRQVFNRFTRLTFAVLLLFCNIGFATWGIVLTYHTDEQKHGKTFSWNLIIHHIIYAVRSIGVHLVLVCCTQTVWKDLWNAFHSMELQLDVGNCHRNLRHVSIIGVVYVAIKEFCLLGLLIEGYRVSPFGSFLSLVVDLVATTFRIYSPSALALFCILSWSVSASFRSIRLEMEQVAKSSEELSDWSAANRLMKWKRSHLAVCECVHQLNRTFGIILLIEITFIFFDVITGSFFILFAIVEDATTGGTWVPLTVAWNAFHLVNLLAMSYVADKLSVEAAKLIRSLRSLEWSMPTQSRLLHQIIGEVYYTVPKISALGFFNVGRRLIPTLLGTTLTYLIILNQFRRAEKE